MKNAYYLIDLFAQPEDALPPPHRQRRTKDSPIEQYYLCCEYCAVHTEWESDVWSWTAGVRECRAQGWRTKNKRWVCPECSPGHCPRRERDLWRCGICGTITEGNPGLSPVIQPDGRRRLVCPECRSDHPELVVAEDGEMYADYPAVDEGKLPFHLAEWLHGQE